MSSESTKTSNGGCPPDDHPRRCQAKARGSQDRCKRWALVGSNYCQFHGGRRTHTVKKGLPYRYSKHLGPKLREAVDEFLAQPHHDQISLYEELAMLRLAATQAIRLAEPALVGNAKIKPATEIGRAHV